MQNQEVLSRSLSQHAFSRFIKIIFRSRAEDIVFVLNYFPSKTEMSNTMRLEMIVESRPKIDFSKKILAFGNFSLAIEGSNNWMKGRETLDIALRTSNNDGGYSFMSLQPCRNVHY